MKNFLTLLVPIFLFANDLFVVGKPIIGIDTNPIITFAINKGFNAQINELLFDLTQKGEDLDIKYLFPELFISNRKEINKLISADKKIEEELKIFIENLDKRRVKNNKSISFNLSNLSLNNISISIKKTDLKKITLKVKKEENKLNYQLKNIMEKLKRLYECEDYCMPYYIFKPFNNKYFVVDYKLEPPKIFFYEKFIPQKRGRRYFIKILIYVINLEDEIPTYEYRIIEDFNWRRNYRFIAAETGVEIRELIYKKFGLKVE